VASPDVIARFPPPREPSDLRDWPAIALKPPSAPARRPWRFATPAGELVMPLDEPAAEVNSPDAGRDMAIAGLGLAMLPRYLVRDDVAAGRLQAVLPGHMVQGPAVHVCTTQRDLLPQRVSRLLQDLVPALRATLALA
jgi:DNA-binding transcriptional LysR family regulator